jgi:putative addiction module killer protein
MKKIALRAYEKSGGGCPFERWFFSLENPARAKIVVALARLELGNFSNVKGVGGSVLEYRVDFGPGYRIYFAQDGEALILLLAGGTKARQQRDIELAKERWLDYKRRKKKGEFDNAIDA